MNRAAWKTYYRTMRIIRRETSLAATDCMIFGTGMVHVSFDGKIERIAPGDWSFAPHSNEVIIRGK